MSINRTKLWLAFALQLLLAAAAPAQELKENEWLPYFKDAQIGPPADLSRYGSGPKRRRGFFATAELIYWAISPPDRTLVGKEGYTPTVAQGADFGFATRATTTSTNTTSTTGANTPGFLTTNFFTQPATLDTGFIQPNLGPGQRYQLGYIDDDGEGWMVGTVVLQSQTQQTVVSNGGVPIFAPFVNGINGLEGFIPGPGGVAQDINGDHIFGPNGQDLGTLLSAGPPPVFTPPFDNIPDVPAPTDFGDLVQFPVIFHSLTAKQVSRMWGIEVMHIWQLPRHRRNRPGLGIWEALAGVRYIRFRDSFLVEGFPDVQQQVNRSSGGGAGGGGTGAQNQLNVGILGHSQWYQTADNNLVGPQIGLRWQAGKGRLSFVMEARGMAAANFQALRQTGFYGKQQSFVTQSPSGVNPGSSGTGTTSQSQAPVVQPGVPINLVPQSFTYTHFATQFAPVGELRLNLNYQVYKSVSVQAGWTGLVMGGMARSANAIDWSLPAFGILTDHTRQAVFIEGVNIGVMINR